MGLHLEVNHEWVTTLCSCTPLFWGVFYCQLHLIITTVSAGVIQQCPKCGQQLRKVRWLPLPLREQQKAKVPHREMDARQGCQQMLRDSTFSALPAHQQPCQIYSISCPTGGLSFKIITLETICLFGKCQNSSRIYLLRNFLLSLFTEHHCFTLYVCQIWGQSLYKAIKQGTSPQDRPTCLRIN